MCTLHGRPAPLAIRCIHLPRAPTQCTGLNKFVVYEAVVDAGPAGLTGERAHKLSLAQMTEEQLASNNRQTCPTLNAHQLMAGRVRFQRSACMLMRWRCWP